MYIYKDPWFHRVGIITIEGETASLTIHSSQPGVEEDEPQLIPIAEGVSPNEQDVVDWLVAPGGYIEGGVPVVNEDYPLRMEKIKALKRVRELRDLVEARGISTPKGTFDTDPDSQRRLLCASISALCAITEENNQWTIQWRMADNSLVTLTAQEMLDASKTAALHFDLAQGNKNSLDSAIEAATTMESIEAIDLTAGWPL